MLSRSTSFALLLVALASGIVACTLREPLPSQNDLASYQQSNLGICDGTLFSSAEVIFVKGQHRLTQTALSRGSFGQIMLHGVTQGEFEPEYSGHLYKGLKLHSGSVIEIGENGFVSLLVGEDKRPVNLQPNSRTFLQCIVHQPIAKVNMDLPNPTLIYSYLSAAVRG